MCFYVLNYCLLYQANKLKLINEFFIILTLINILFMFMFVEYKCFLVFLLCVLFKRQRFLCLSATLHNKKNIILFRSNYKFN